MDELVREAVRIVMTVRDETKEKNVQIEMGWVGERTGGKHEVNIRRAARATMVRPLADCIARCGAPGGAVGQVQAGGGGHGRVSWEDLG